MLADDAVPAVAFAAVAAAVAFLIVVAVSLPPVAEALFDATFLVVVAVSSLHLPLLPIAQALAVFAFVVLTYGHPMAFARTASYLEH